MLQQDMGECNISTRLSRTEDETTWSCDQQLSLRKIPGEWAMISPGTYHIHSCGTCTRFSGASVSSNSVEDFGACLRREAWIAWIAVSSNHPMSEASVEANSREIESRVLTESEWFGGERGRPGRQSAFQTHVIVWTAVPQFGIDSPALTDGCADQAKPWDGAEDGCVEVPGGMDEKKGIAARASADGHTAPWALAQSRRAAGAHVSLGGISVA